MLDRTETLAACIAGHASHGPRYTSYPPATEFRPLGTEAVWRELAQLASARDPVSLYAHIPFCRSLCAYCGCNVIPTRDASRGEAYVEELITEMALVARGDMRAPVVEIALGGGSPNFLSPQSLRHLIVSMERLFDVRSDARRSVELDPRTTTSSQIDALADLSFRSMSMGVQDFAQGVQDAIRRHQSVTQTRWLVDRARASGFDDINIDVVYGLPRQTEESFATTIDTVIDLAPDRVAVFGYAHLPSKLPHQRIVERAGRVLDSYERATLLLIAIEKFAQAGYIHIGLDHFARPNSRLAIAAREQRVTRTFQGYVEKRADSIIGFGTSAISSTPRMYWQNHGELRDWQRAIGEGQLPVHRGIILDRDDRARRQLIQHLMCNGEVNLDEVAAELDVDPERYFATELANVGANAELATYDAATRRVATSDLGRLLVRNVCKLFDRYADDASSRRFSPTV